MIFIVKRLSLSVSRNILVTIYSSENLTLYVFLKIILGNFGIIKLLEKSLMKTLQENWLSTDYPVRRSLYLCLSATTIYQA